MERSVKRLSHVGDAYSKKAIIYHTRFKLFLEKNTTVITAFKLRFYTLFNFPL